MRLKQSNSFKKYHRYYTFLQTTTDLQTQKSFVHKSCTRLCARHHARTVVEKIAKVDKC